MAAPTMTSKLVAEFTGTFLLVLTIACNVLSQSGMWAGVSIACVLMVSIFAFGGISGANFNPAVSVALGLNGNLGWKDVGTYAVVQLLGGISAGTFAQCALFGKGFSLSPTKDFKAGFVNEIWHAGACEALYTFMLCFVVLNVAAVKKGCQEWFGLAIGFVIIAGAYGAGPISGGCFNPAVAFGNYNILFGFGRCLSYTLFELVGAALAAVAFKVVRPGGGTVDEEYSLTSKLAAEFLGTYMLVLTVGLNVLAKSPACAFSIAASLMCMIYALGDVSGANFNPAVTFALLIQKAIDIKTSLAYAGTQIIGGLAAALTYHIICHDTFPLAPGKQYLLWQACLAEVLFTFVLVLVVLCVAVNPKTKSANFFGLAIGSCVTVGGFAIGAISGGSMNPAVSIGIGAFGKSTSNAFCYSCAECFGATIAAGLVMLTHLDGVDKDEKDPEA